MLCRECSRHFKHEYNGVPLKDLGKASKNVLIWDRIPGRYISKHAQKGCEICARLYTALSQLGHLFCSNTDGHPLESHNLIDSVEVVSYLRFCTVSWEPKSITFIFGSHLNATLSDLTFNFYRHEEENDRPLMPLAGNSIDSISCFQFYSSSLSTCIQSHKICRESYIGDTDVWLPSRLIQIHPSQAIRLIERDDLRERTKGCRAEYFTLSHVWGTEKFLTLTTQNMTQLKREIQLIELPKCFQEAITAARRLGGQYLWIDSLCIIQDSPHDWAIESEQMHRVYSNGICNLAASNQSISNRGLFCNRDPTMGSPFTVDSFWSDGTRAEKYVLNPNFAHLFTSYGPLYRRAWVVQEQQLSPRTIHMTPFPVWECREAILTEHFPSTEAFGLYKPEYIPTKISLSRDEDSLIKTWTRLTFSYSGCGLTKDVDRLIALCGVAKVFSQAFRSRYLAGIWEDFLLEGLLWCTMEEMSEMVERGGTRRCKEYVAPSWSWASVKGIILPFDDKKLDVPLVDVLSVDTQPNNGDHFGQLCGGSLTLDGVLFEFPRISDMLLDHPNFVRKTSYNVDALALDDCGVDDYGGSDTWFLPLAVTSAASRHPGLNICGIILQKARGNSETAAYTRIGRAVVSHDGDIAGSGWLIRDWISRPWSKDYYQTIEIV